VYWQQDGAPPHWALNIRAYLNANFGQRWSGRGGPTSWPPRSPDLAPPDIFSLGLVERSGVPNQAKNSPGVKRKHHITVQKLM